MIKNDNAKKVALDTVRMAGDKETTASVTKSTPEFLHNDLKGLKEIILSDKERYKEALAVSPQRTWLNYFPFLLYSNFIPSRSILLGEECGSLCVYLLRHGPRKDRLHLYLPPMPMRQEALDHCFERINTFNGDYSGRLWWISGELKDAVKQSGNFILRPGDEEFIYQLDMFQNLNNSKFQILRYQLRRAERKQPIDARLFTAQDKKGCLELLEKWYQAKTDKSIKALNYFYAKACIELCEQFPPNDLHGYVYMIEGKIVAFAFGGQLAGETSCSFLNITDHDFISLGYFTRQHFFKNMQQYTTINDGGTVGFSGLSFVKNNMRPIKIETIYRARQKRSHESMTQVNRSPQAEREDADSSRLQVLRGLKPLGIEDQEIFIQHIKQAKKKSWLSFFPFLHSFSQRAQTSLYWELYRGSICLYYLRERPSGKRLSLYFPPFPFRSRTLAYAMDKVTHFNQRGNSKITWVGEEDMQEISRLGYDVINIENEYIYSKADLDKFLQTCTVQDNIATSPYTREDEAACLKILERWKADNPKRVRRNLTYHLGRSCIQNASQYIDNTIIGEVLRIDGDIQGFCFAGVIDTDYVSFFVTITAPQYNKLKLYQQARISRNFSASFYNNSEETTEDSAPYLNKMVRPVAMHQMFRARKVHNKTRGTFQRELRDINTALFIKAARELNFKVDIVKPPYNYCVISYGDKALHVYHNATSITDVVTRKVTHNKYLSQNILRSHGIPVPASKIFSPEDVDNILKHVEKHRPVVIKPVTGSRSRGVTVDPQNAEEVLQAVARIQNNKVMIEQLIHGDCYRILIYKNKIIDVLHWFPPYVIGNGLDSLFNLVEVKNDYYRQNNMYLIQVDFDYLGRQGINMGFVPEKGQRIYLHHSQEHYVGGEPVQVDLQSIHPDNIKMFLKVAQVSGLPLAGLDFISKDLSIFYNENGAGINEINSNPEMWPHYFCEQKEDITAIKAILEGFFSNGNN
ncbi:MAG: phosphatidylglycerol lysyltransferase domain-containing protein [Desulfocapsaceae bacterium]|nr:phosphatidylglycerol lysyltransferase domain-containing protein [Desulfocapsaceae bacterium]